MATLTRSAPLDARSAPRRPRSAPRRRRAPYPEAVAPSQAEFQRIFEAHKAAVYRFLVRLTRDLSDAEDLLQDVFLTFWRKADSMRGEGEATELAFLRKIAYRLFLNTRTKANRRAALAPPTEERTHAPADGAVADQEAIEFLMTRVREVLDELPEAPRDAFVLFRFEGLTCREIAEISETPIKTVETRVRRATKLLAERLARYEQLLPR